MTVSPTATLALCDVVARVVTRLDGRGEPAERGQRARGRLLVERGLRMELVDVAGDPGHNGSMSGKLSPGSLHAGCACSLAVDETVILLTLPLHCY